MIKFTAFALSILVSGCSTAPAFASLAAPNNQMPSQHRGCNPRTDRNGCADKGAPVKLVNSKAYLIVAIGHKKGEGMFGYADRTIKRNDLTSMKPQDKKSNDFPVAVTYVNSEFTSATLLLANKETKCKPVKKTKEFEPPDCGMPDAEQGSGSR